VKRFTGKTKVRNHAVDAIRIFVECIKTKIILHYQVNNQRRADAGGEAENIDQRERFVAPEISESNAEIVFYHRFKCLMSDVMMSDFFYSII